MADVIKLFLICGTIVLLAGGVLLALPDSKFRDFMLPIVAWCFAIFCGIYMISPVDLVPEAVAGPFGLVDDFGALLAGISAVRYALKAGREQQTHTS